MLTGQASSLIQGRRARVAATSTINGHLTTIDDTLSAKNMQVCIEGSLTRVALFVPYILSHVINLETDLANVHIGLTHIMENLLL